MRLRHIEIFQAIRQAGSISGAAEFLHVSQPSVTKVLQHAEAQLGFALFRRVKGKLLITPEAQALEMEVRKVTTSLEGVRRLAESLRQMPTETLRIGATPALASSLLPRVVASWLQRHENSRFELSSLHSQELVQNLFMREIDLALTFRHPEHPGLDVIPVITGDLLLLNPIGHKFNSASKPVDISELASEQLIGVSSIDPMFSQLGSYLANVEPSPQTAVRVQTYSLARSLVESGVGVAIVDPFTAYESNSSRSKIAKLNPPCSVTLYAMKRANEPESQSFKALLQILNDQATAILNALNEEPSNSVAS